MYGCGLRVSEASALNIADISLTAGVLAVQAGKGNVHRLVPLNTLIQHDFNQYITYYRKAQITEKAFLLNANNQRLSPMCARLLLKRIASRCNIAVSPHQLRHSIATHLLANGLNVLYVKAFLGHKSLSSTQIYTHVSNAQLADIGAFHHQLIKIDN